MIENIIFSKRTPPFPPKVPKRPPDRRTETSSSTHGTCNCQTYAALLTIRYKHSLDEEAIGSAILGGNDIQLWSRSCFAVVRSDQRHCAMSRPELGPCTGWLSIIKILCFSQTISTTLGVFGSMFYNVLNQIIAAAAIPWVLFFHLGSR